MSKTYTYVVIAITMMLIMTFMGLPTGFSNVLEQVGLNYSNATGTIEAVDVVGSSLFQFLFNNTTGILILATGAAIAIGFVTKSPVENIIMLPFITGILVIFVSTFAGIMNQVIGGTAPAWAAALIVTIFLPITVGLVISLAEWFKGADN